MQNSGGPGPVETRNVFIAIALSLAIFLGFEFFYNIPARERAAEAQRAQIEAQAETGPGNAAGEGRESGAAAPREQVLTQSAGARITIDTPAVDGSIALEGARIDDLNLRSYRQTEEEGSAEVTLLSPINSQFGHDAFFGWEQQAGADVATLAGADSGWSAPAGATLTPETPVTLTLDVGDGLSVARTISIDNDYMFTITDVVRNAGESAASVRPFGTVRRRGMPQDYVQQPIVHQGMIGVFGPSTLRQAGFTNAEKHARNKARARNPIPPEQRIRQEVGQGGWIGLTEHYWLTAIVPAQDQRIEGYFDSRPERGTTDFRSAYRGAWRDVPAGGEVTYTQRLFAGAKRYELLEHYQSTLNIPRFDDAIDWGNFWFLTRPFFQWLLHPFAQFFGGVYGFGFAILLSTIVIKLLMFPLVYQSFKAMAKMRGLAPKMKELQERYAADKQRQQQEILKLYQTEQVNPVSGCVPILLQIPVFYALYKTLTVTIEMRHADFPGWINDLSARDPTSLFNLFGLLPYELSPTFLGGALIIGVWPLLYGVSMWALQGLSPPPTDQIQAQILRFLPILFTFMFAAFPAGLVIYWTWSNVLSIAQQYVIMRRQGVETELDKFIAKRFPRSAAPAE